MDDGRIAVIGLGYVGLPLAIAFAEAGREVVGLDASHDRIAQLAAGSSPIDDIDDARLGAALASGHFSVAHTDETRLADVDVVFVCVPTPISESKDPDLGAVTAA